MPAPIATTNPASAMKPVVRTASLSHARTSSLHALYLLRVDRPNAMPAPRPTTPAAAVILAGVVKWRGTPSVIVVLTPPMPPPLVGFSRTGASGRSRRAELANRLFASDADVRSIAGRDA